MVYILFGLLVSIEAKELISKNNIKAIFSDKEILLSKEQKSFFLRVVKCKYLSKYNKIVRELKTLEKVLRYKISKGNDSNTFNSIIIRMDKLKRDANVYRLTAFNKLKKRVSSKQWSRIYQIISN
jgi:hypothetical protein